MAKIGKSRGEWRALVHAFRSSGLTLGSFAARHGVTEATLRWWCSEVRNRRDEVAFIDVVVDETAAQPLTVVVAGVGHKVVVPPGFDAVELRRLVEALC